LIVPKFERPAHLLSFGVAISSQKLSYLHRWMVTATSA
jgi:hypothetical protein